MSFNNYCYNFLNTEVRNSILPLLKDIDADIGSNLQDFYKHLTIGECRWNWYVEVLSKEKVNMFGPLETNVEDIKSYYGEYEIIYKNTILFILKLRIEDEKIFITNRYEILVSFDELVCKKCKLLRNECTCEKPIRQTSEKLKAQSLNIPIIKFKAGLVPSQKTNTIKLSDDEIQQMSTGIAKQLGLNKRQVTVKIKDVLAKNPNLNFDEVVDAVLKTI